MRQVCTVAEAKAIYPLMGIAANVALVAAGNFMKAINLALKVAGPSLPACRHVTFVCDTGTASAGAKYQGYHRFGKLPAIAKAAAGECPAAK